MTAHKKINSLIMSVLYAALAPMALDVSGVTVMYFVPALASAAEPSKIEPKLSCQFRGLFQSETRKGESRTGDLEKTSDGAFVTGNLTGLLLDVRLDGGGWRVQQLEKMYSELRPPPPWKVSKKPTVRVAIDSLSENKEDISFFLGSSGVSGENNTAYIHLHFRLPIDEAERRKIAQEYFQRMINSAAPNDTLIQRLLDKKEGMIGALSSLAAQQNKPGTYRISCSYHSGIGPWIGTVHAEPLILKIVFEKSFFDREIFGLGSNEFGNGHRSN